MADRFNVVSRITDLLDALWQLQARLPEPVGQALLAGQAAGTGYRGIASVTDADREALLAKMLPITDFRVYDSPPQLAAQVDALVNAHAGRLLDAESGAWQALHLVLQQGGDATTYLRAVEKLLGEYPAVQQLIGPHKRWAPQPVLRGADMAFGTPKGIAGAPTSRGLSRRSRPQPARRGRRTAGEVSRYANVTFPSKVLVTQQMVPLVVHLAGQYQATGVFTADQAHLSLQAGDLTVVVLAQDFDVALSIGGVPGTAGAIERTVQVAADRDCEPLVFFLNPRSAGRKQIQIGFRQFDRELRTLSFETEIVADAAALSDLANVGRPARSHCLTGAGQGCAAARSGAAGDALAGEGTRLTYYLHSPGESDYNFKPVGAANLERDPAGVSQADLRPAQHPGQAFRRAAHRRSRPRR